MHIATYSCEKKQIIYFYLYIYSQIHRKISKDAHQTDGQGRLKKIFALSLLCAFLK